MALISRNLIVNGLLTIFGQRLPIPSTHIQLKIPCQRESYGVHTLQDAYLGRASTTPLKHA